MVGSCVRTGRGHAAAERGGGVRRGLPGAEAGRLGRPRFPVPRRPGAAGAAAALHDRRRPGGEPVLVLHGTAGSGAGMLTPAFAGELFGPGQPLDASKYYIILPDAIGAGGSSKPSDGMRASFPRYNYDDMIAAQYRLLTEGLGVHHLRLVIGNSMGGMETWIWGEQHPEFMDALVPMASQPTAMASRNWMMRRMIDRRRPHATRPGRAATTPSSRRSCATPTSGSASPPAAARWPTPSRRRRARRPTSWSTAARRRRSPPTRTTCCTSGTPRATTTPAPELERITAPVLVINSADDERNPPETGLLEQALKQVQNAKYLPDPGQRGDARAWHDGHGEVLPASSSANSWPSVPKQVDVSRSRHGRGCAGTVTPIMSPSRTSAARRASSQPSVPAGRRGRTIQR